MKKATHFVFAVCLILWLTHCKKNGSDEPGKTMVTTIAGTGESGYLDATAAFAKFDRPADVAIHTDGTVYITDFNNRRIRKLTPEGLVFTFAGNGNPGNVNGSATMASFTEPAVITTDAPGNVYLLDGSNPQLRRITPGGDVAAFAFTAMFGFADGRADSAQFSQGWGIAIAGNGKIYVADTYNERIRKIENGYVTTVAGTGVTGYADGNALQATFNKPRGIAVDKQGNLYVADENNYCIRKITPAGAVSTYAGVGTQGFADGGPGTAQFYYPGDMVIDKKGNLYVSDNHRVRKVGPNGDVSTIAGSKTPGFADGEGSMALFSYVSGLGVDAADNIYVADSRNHRIRKISYE